MYGKWMEDMPIIIDNNEVKIVDGDIWVRIPSGWICAKYNGDIYLK